MEKSAVDEHEGTEVLVLLSPYLASTVGHRYAGSATTLAVRRLGSPAPVPRRRPVRGWPPVWTAAGLLLVAGLFRAAQNMGQTTFALFGRDDLNLGAATIGSLGTVLGAFALVAALFVGGRLPASKASAAVGAGVCLLGASLVVLGSATSPWQFAGGTALLGLAGGATAPSLATAVGQATPEGRDRALAHYAAVLSMSLALGPLAETGLLELAHQHLRLPFFVFAALPVAALALGLFGRLRANALGVANSPDPLHDSPLGSSGQLRSLLATGDGRMALTVQLLYAVPFSAITVFGALVARSVFNMTPAGAQLAFTVFFAASLLSRLVVARISPIDRKRRAFLLAAALTAAGVVLLSVGGPPLLLFIAMVLLGVPHGVTFPLALALTAQSVGEDQLAASNAALFAATSVVAVAAPVVLGVVAAAAGYRVMIVLVLAPVAAFSMLLMAQP